MTTAIRSISRAANVGSSWGPGAGSPRKIVNFEHLKAEKRNYKFCKCQVFVSIASSGMGTFVKKTKGLLWEKKNTLCTELLKRSREGGYAPHALHLCSPCACHRVSLIVRTSILRGRHTRSLPSPLLSYGAPHNSRDQQAAARLQSSMLTSGALVEDPGVFH